MSTDKPSQKIILAIATIPQRIIRYISGAVARIFGPTDDEYPKTGVQPFEGDIPDPRKTRYDEP